MKKTILIWGLISGAISSLLMDLSTAFADKIGFGHSYILGYTILVLSSLMVYFGVRSYRDNYGNGQISFGRAFAVGISIVMISSVLYVISWEIVYYNFMPDFMDKYSAYEVGKLRAAGASAAAIQAQVESMRKMAEMYKNPLINAAMTFIEPFPVGLVFALLSALILKKKPQPQPAALPAS
jgi:hypothetical protein